MGGRFCSLDQTQLECKSTLVEIMSFCIGGQYRGTFMVPVPSVLLWYRYRGTLLFFGGTGTLVLFYFLVGILRK